MWIKFSGGDKEAVRTIAQGQGYKIVDGQVVIFEEEAAKVRMVFKEYLTGTSLVASAKKAGFNMTHSSVKRMLKKKIYLGDDYYPRIIDEDTFYKANKMLEDRARKLGRVKVYKPEKEIKIPCKFSLNAKKKSFNDPFEKARYLYQHIESEGFLDE